MSYEFRENIELVVDEFGLGDEVLSKSTDLMQTLLDENYTRRFTPYGGFDAMVGVSVYTAAHQCRVPVSPERFEKFFREREEFDVTKHFYSKKIRDVNRMLVRELGLDNVVYVPDDFIAVAESELGLSGGSWEMVGDLLSMVEEEAESLVGKSPKAVAGSCIYLVSVLNDEGVTQSEISDCLSLSEVAIRYTYKEVIESLTEISTDDLKLTDVEITPTTLGLEGDYQ